MRPVPQRPLDISRPVPRSEPRAAARDASGAFHGRGRSRIAPLRSRAPARPGNRAAAIFLAVTVLAVNLLGDGLRDALDPRMAKRI